MVISSTWEGFRGTISPLCDIVLSYRFWVLECTQQHSPATVQSVPSMACSVGNTKSILLHRFSYPVQLSIPDTQLQVYGTTASPDLPFLTQNSFAIFPQDPPLTWHLLTNQLHIPGKKGKFRRRRSPGHVGSTQKTAIHRHSGTVGSSCPRDNSYWRGNFTAATVVKRK